MPLPTGRNKFKMQYTYLKCYQNIHIWLYQLLWQWIHKSNNFFFGEMRNIFQFCCLVCFYINAKLTDFCLNWKIIIFLISPKKYFANLLHIWVRAIQNIYLYTYFFHIFENFPWRSMFFSWYCVTKRVRFINSSSFSNLL